MADSVPSVDKVKVVGAANVKSTSIESFTAIGEVATNRKNSSLAPFASMEALAPTTVGAPTVNSGRAFEFSEVVNTPPACDRPVNE